MTPLEDLAKLDLATSRDPADMAAYSRDLFPRHHMAVRSGNVAAHAPFAVVWPESSEDVARLVRYAMDRRVPLVPFGAGSGVCAGVLPTEQTIVVDLKRMARIRELDRATRTVDGRSRRTWACRSKKRSIAQGLTLGHFPSSILCSTVGGWVAARSAGQAVGLYGKIEDMVVALECVTGSGEIVRLVHRPHGPSLVPADHRQRRHARDRHVGEASTSSRAHRARLRRVVDFRRREAGWNAMRELFQSGLRPAVLSSLRSVRRDARAARRA